MRITITNRDEIMMGRYLGVGLGLLIGDAHCAPYEGGLLERGLWKCIGTVGDRGHTKRRYTDDSQSGF